MKIEFVCKDSLAEPSFHFRVAELPTDEASFRVTEPTQNLYAK